MKEDEDDPVFQDYKRRKIAQSGSFIPFVPEAEGRCDYCETTKPLAKAPIRTAYANGEQPQPTLCEECTKDWHDHWDSMWDAYYS